MIKSTFHSVLVAAVGAVLVCSSWGQELLDRQTLSVSQRCALKLVQKPVAEKLKLTPAQIGAVKHAEEAYSEEYRKLSSEHPPRLAALEASNKKLADACLSALTPSQKHELLKIGIPEIGISALLDPAISAQIGLTSVELHKVRAINIEFAKKDEDFSAMIANAMIAIPEPKAGADRSEYDKKCADTLAMYDGERQRMDRERAASSKKILAALTPNQRARWKELSGAR